MKKQLKTLLTIALALVLALGFVSCADKTAQTSVSDTTGTSTESPSADTEKTTAQTEKIAAEGVWADALYRSDKSFGEGKKVIEVEVKANDSSVVFTIKTDKATLGEALIENNLVEGEQGAYGLYIKKVNGITADYDIDKHYWSLSKNGTALMTGADLENISGGEHYEIVRTK